jgi:hypothetical protein
MFSEAAAIKERNGEYEITIFDWHMARKAIVHDNVGGFTVVNWAKPQPPVEAHFFASLTMN